MRLQERARGGTRRSSCYLGNEGLLRQAKVAPLQAAQHTQLEIFVADDAHPLVCPAKAVFRLRKAASSHVTLAAPHCVRPNLHPVFPPPPPP